MKKTIREVLNRLKYPINLDGLTVGQAEQEINLIHKEQREKKDDKAEVRSEVMECG